MTLVINDRVKETTTTTGTGTVDLDGAETGFEGFVAAIGDANTTYYALRHRTEDEWEVGLGTVSDATPDTLARTTPISSSNGDAAVNFSAGTIDVFCTIPASRVAVYPAAPTATGLLYVDPNGHAASDGPTWDGSNICLGSYGNFKELVTGSYFRVTNNEVHLAPGGLLSMFVSKTYASFGNNASSFPLIKRGSATETIPVYCIYGSDQDTGIGGAEGDAVSLVAGGVARVLVDDDGVTITSGAADRVTAIHKAAAAQSVDIYQAQISDGTVGAHITKEAVLATMERSSDPVAPTEGQCIIWLSDGTGKGDDGDVMIASMAGGVANYGTLFDHSGGAAY